MCHTDNMENNLVLENIKNVVLILKYVTVITRKSLDPLIFFLLSR